MLKGLQDKARSIANQVAYGSPPTDVPPGLDALSLVRLEGGPLPIEALRGKVVMFVNVASRCGLTPQYEGLVKLYHHYRERGFVIIGVPCNQFMGQEPGSAEEIAQFCSMTYGVDFPLLEKQDVNGAQRAPLYRWLIAESGDTRDIRWNFEKFLVGRDGKVIARFAHKAPPDSPEIARAIETALG